MNKDLLEIQKHFLNKNYKDVIKISKEKIKNGSNIPGFFNLLSASLEVTGKINEAEKVLLEAIKSNPDETSFRANIGRIQILLNKFKDSEINLIHGLRIDDKDHHLLFQYGLLKLKAKSFQEALKIFKKLCELNIKYPDALLNLAQSYLDLGYQDNKQEYYEKAKKLFLDCSNLFPERVYVDFQLSDLIDYSQDRSHQKIMLKKFEKLNLNSRQKAFICKGLAKSFEDQEKFDQAYEFIKLCNDMRNKSVSKNIITNEIQKSEKIKKIFLNINLSDLRIKTILKKKIIFIVGMPRSGTTLIHQLLDSSNQAEGLGESPILDRNLNKKIFDKNFFDNLFKNKKFNKDLFLNVGNDIANEFNKTSAKNILIDKLPINFYWIGFIKLLFPSAKVVHVNRNLKDVCLSIYKNLFGNKDLDWSYNEENILAFTENYRQMMSFWKERYENYIYEIKYEELINNSIDETKKLFNFCDLEWDEKIFNFYYTGKRIKTASISQVKKPIYSNSINSSDKYIEKMTFLKKL